MATTQARLMGAVRSARALAVGAAVAWLACSAAVQAQVYRCTQEGGRVLYSDEPCKGGTVVDVRAGAANGAAVQKLARDNAAFDEKMAVRRAAEDQAELQRQQLYAQFEAARAAQGSATWGDVGPYYYYDPAGAYVTTPDARRHTHGRRVPHAREREHRVPATPANPAHPTGVRRQTP